MDNSFITGQNQSAGVRDKWQDNNYDGQTQTRPWFRCAPSTCATTDSVIDRIKQYLIINRFFKKAVIPLLIALVSFLFIIAGNYDYQQLGIQLSQSIQNRKAAHRHHAEVQHKTSRLIVFEKAEKIGAASEGVCSNPRWPQQPLQRLANRFFVVNDGDKPYLCS
jgi:hypothetical protein